MRLTLLLIAASIASAQCTILIQPFPLAATQRIFANGREAGLWKVVERNHTALDCKITRQDIETFAPGVTFFASDVALDLLERKADLSKWAIIARYGKLGLSLAPAGLAMYGAISGVNGFTIGGAGLGVFQFVIDRSAANAPNPARYAAQFLPDRTVLAASEGAEYYMAAGLTHGAAPMGPFLVDQFNSMPIAPAPPSLQQPTPGAVIDHGTAGAILKGSLGVLPQSMWGTDRDWKSETQVAAMRGGWGRQIVEVASR